MAVIEIKVPSIAESVTEVTLSQWLKADGDMVAIDEPICEFESDKATLELPAEVAGKLIHVATEGSDLKIGDVIARIDTSAAGAAPPKTESKPAEPAKVAEPAPATQSANYATGTPSPAAAKIMAERGVENIEGTGRDGRITKDDAVKAAQVQATAPAAPVAKVESPKVETKPTPTPQYKCLLKHLAAICAVKK